MVMMAKIMACRLFLSLLALLVSQTETSPIKVDTKMRQFVDDLGYAHLFHGVNVVYKSFPYYPSNGSFDAELSFNAEDIDFMVEHGFNVVRLYVAWQGVEPTKGQYNYTYLMVLKNLVNRLGEMGIFTILDCHQDVFSPKFCGEGAPDFAALYENRTVKPLPFPEPMAFQPYKINPATGYPYRSDCNSKSFFLYYFSDAVSKSMQSLYDNEQGIQDHFASFWGTVAQFFSDNDNVLGYEIINEPWAGDFYSHPDQLEPHIADPKNLAPLYKKVHSAIREHDEKHIIFFEPTTIITNLPLKKFSATGLTEGPGGEEYNDRQVFSYHLYCILMDSNGQPSNTLLCDGDNSEIMSMRMTDSERMGVAGFLTEWGAYDNYTFPGSKPYNDAVDITGLADSSLQSWTYWQYKGYGDFTTQSSTAEGLWLENGTNQYYKLKLLSRTSAQRVAGRYISQKFDPETGNYSLVFAVDTTVTAPTDSAIIFLNEMLYYPNGYDVSVGPAGGVSYSTSHNSVLVTVYPDKVVDGQHITVTITAKTA